MGEGVPAVLIAAVFLLVTTVSFLIAIYIWADHGDTADAASIRQDAAA